jgi:hypothetical protein
MIYPVNHGTALLLAGRNARPKPNASPFKFQAAPDARKQLDAPNLTGKRTKARQGEAAPNPKERDQKTQETNKQTKSSAAAAAALTWVSGGGRGSRGGSRVPRATSAGFRGGSRRRGHAVEAA